MKFRLLAAVVATLAAGQSYAAHTYYQDEDGLATIDRDWRAGADGDDQLSVCIALPDVWEGDLQVSVAGSAGGESFSAALSDDAENATTLNTSWGYDGFSWQCFADVVRTFDDEDSAEISLTFAPGSADMTVLTATGVSAVYGIDSPDSMQTQRLLVNAEYTDHWMPVGEGSGWDYVSRAYEANGALFYVSPVNPLIKIDEDGVQVLSGSPHASSIDYLNGHYVLALDGYYADEDDETFFIQSSTDLQNWQDSGQIELLDGLYYNEALNQYLASAGGFDAKELYVSSDLQSWTYNGERPENDPTPYSTFFFFNNGDTLYLVDGEAYDTEFYFRSAGESSWTELSPFPEGTPDDGDVAGFYVLDYVQDEDGSVSVIGYYGYGGEYDYDWDEGMYGHTDNGTDWTWHSVGDWTDPYEDVGDVYFAEDMLIIADDYTDDIYYSFDQGETLQQLNIDSLSGNLINIPEGVSADIEGVWISDGRFYVALTLSIRDPEAYYRYSVIAKILVSTSDFSDTRIEMMADQDFYLRTTSNGKQYLQLDGFWSNSGDIFYLYGTPSPEEEITDDIPQEDGNDNNDDSQNGSPADSGSSGGSSGGALWMLSLIMLPLVLCRRSEKANVKNAALLITR